MRTAALTQPLRVREGRLQCVARFKLPFRPTEIPSNIMASNMRAKRPAGSRSVASALGANVQESFDEIDILRGTLQYWEKPASRHRSQGTRHAHGGFPRNARRPAGLDRQDERPDGPDRAGEEGLRRRAGAASSYAGGVGVWHTYDGRGLRGPELGLKGHHNIVIGPHAGRNWFSVSQSSARPL